MRTFSVSRSPRLVVAATLALVVAACGSGAPSATSVPSPSAAAPSAAAAGSAAPAASASAPASAAATTSVAACGTYAGPPATITYAMWGDTTELANQQKIVDAFTKLNPSITVKVSVADWDSYWPKLQVDLAAGNAPDVFLMDGPLYPCLLYTSDAADE